MGRGGARAPAFKRGVTRRRMGRHARGLHLRARLFKNPVLEEGRKPLVSKKKATTVWLLVFFGASC